MNSIVIVQLPGLAASVPVQVLAVIVNAVGSLPPMTVVASFTLTVAGFELLRFFGLPVPPAAPDENVSLDRAFSVAAIPSPLRLTAGLGQANPISGPPAAEVHSL